MMKKMIIATALFAVISMTMTACGNVGEETGNGNVRVQVQAASGETGTRQEDVSGTQTEGQTAVQENQEESKTGVTGDPTAAIRVSPDEEYYIFELNDDVEREHVYYRTRYGIEVAADLYTAKDMDRSGKYPAIVVGPPFGGVKEQGPGVYANELARRGFVVLAIDPAYHGYSGGQPRNVGSPDTYVEDFSAGVDFLGTQEFVDRERIGALGICASGGFALGAAAQDTRIKAVATSVMYDIPGLANSATGEDRANQLDELGKQRWEDFVSGTAEFSINYPEEPVDEVPEDLDPVSAEFFSFYGTRRGWHPHALSNITATSNMSFMNFPATTHINEIAPRPILFVVGENAHSRPFTETAYENASEPKEIYVVPDANHVDLYDQVDKIPFDKFEDFFNENLR